ncbi:MAG: hypothetical protein V3V97_06505, partial [Hyphomicrobiaceae bacterium]
MRSADNALGGGGAVHRHGQGTRAFNADLRQDLRLPCIAKDDTGALTPKPGDRVGIDVKGNVRQFLQLKDLAKHLP